MTFVTHCLFVLILDSSDEWSHSIMVSTTDFDSVCLGSNPGGTFLSFFNHDTRIGTPVLCTNTITTVADSMSLSQLPDPSLWRDALRIQQERLRTADVMYPGCGSKRFDTPRKLTPRMATTQEHGDQQIFDLAAYLAQTDVRDQSTDSQREEKREAASDRWSEIEQKSKFAHIQAVIDRNTASRHQLGQSSLHTSRDRIATKRNTYIQPIGTKGALTTTDE